QSNTSGLSRRTKRCYQRHSSDARHPTRACGGKARQSCPACTVRRTEMVKTLNDTQLTILSNAAARDDRRVLPLPKLKAPPTAVIKTIKSMIAAGLVEQIRATRDDETWEHAEGVDRTTLIITPAGLAAIGIADEATSSAKSGDKAVERRTRARKA